MEQRHPDDKVPRVEDLFAAGIAAMKAPAEPKADTSSDASEPAPPPEAPVNYRGATQATVREALHMPGKGPTEAPKVALSEKPTVALADDEDIEW